MFEAAFYCSKHSAKLNFDLVDLGFLKFAGMIDVQGFPFAEDVQNLRSRFAMAVAGRLCSAERKVNFRTDRRLIHIANSGVKFLHRIERIVHVLRVDRRRKSVFHAVHDLDRLVER